MTETGRLIFIEEMIRELYRAGIVTQDMLDSVSGRLGVEAENLTGSSRSAPYELAQHLADILPLEASAAPVRASDARADFKRRQMVERTALIAKSDGGNSP